MSKTSKNDLQEKTNEYVVFRNTDGDYNHLPLSVYKKKRIVSGIIKRGTIGECAIFCSNKNVG